MGTSARIGLKYGRIHIRHGLQLTLQIGHSVLGHFHEHHEGKVRAQLGRLRLAHITATRNHHSRDIGYNAQSIIADGIDNQVRSRGARGKPELCRANNTMLCHPDETLKASNTFRQEEEQEQQ